MQYNIIVCLFSSQPIGMSVQHNIIISVSVVVANHHGCAMQRNMLVLQAPMYYRQANAALLVYDITSLKSFADVKHWVFGK